MNIDSFVTALTRRGRLVLPVTAVLMILAVVGIFRLEIQTDFSVFMPPDSPALAAMNRAAEAFGDSDQLLLVAEVPGTGQAPDHDALRQLPALTAGLADIAGVESAQSVVPASVENASDGEIDALLEQALTLGATSTLIRHESGWYAIIRLLLAQEADERQILRAVRDRFESQEIPVIISGEPYLQAEVFSYILRIILTIPPVAILLMLLVFRVRIGSFRATVMSMVPAIVGAVLTLGAVGWFVGSVSIVTVLAPIFIIVLGSADGLHITSHVTDNLRAGHSNEEAVRRTLKAVGIPVILTTLTTMAGFLSLLVINSTAIRQLGAGAAVGIVVAGLATWLILPAILLHAKPLPHTVGVERPNRVAAVLSRLRGWPSVVLAVVLVAAFVPGALRLRANMSMIDIYRPRTEVRQNIERTTELLGGSIPVYVTFPDDGNMDPATAAAVLELQDRAEGAGLAGQSLSAYAIVRNMWETASGNAGYPPNRAVAKTLVMRINRMNPDFTGSFLAENGTGRATFFLHDLDNETLGAFTSLAEEVAASTGLAMEPVGTAFVMKEMNDQIIPQQMASLGLAAVLVFLLTAITQRNLLLGLASTTPIIITLIALYGVMGYARIDLSVITGIMSGLTMGVGIDYAIHYVSLLQQARKRGDRQPQETAVRYVATPVLANALGLAIGFTAMLFSPLQIHVTLSILMWVTMICSAVLSLTFLPTITRRRQSGG